MEINIIPYLIIIFFSTLLSFILKGLIDKFLKEEELYEAYEEEHEEDFERDLTKEEEKVHREAIKKLKSKFTPTYSIPLFFATSILIGVLYYFHGLSLQFFIYSFLTLILEISFVTDIKMCIIPNETNYFSIFIGIIYCISMFFVDKKVGTDLLLGGVIAFLAFFLIGAISYLILKKEGMGGGDTKLVLAIGLFMGIMNFIQIFVLSFLIGGLISILLLISKKKTKEDYIPFGPSICIATYVTMLMPFMTTATLWFKMMIE